MIASQTIPDFLIRACQPSERGIVGLTDQLLEACAGNDIEFEKFGTRCVCRWMVNDDVQEFDVPLPPVAFRTMLARIAVLCNKHAPDSVSPYGGTGQLVVKGNPFATVIQVNFVNTPEKQLLHLKSVITKIPEAVQSRSLAEPLPSTPWTQNSEPV